MEGIKFFIKSPDEILKIVKIIKENRCSYTNEDEAHSNSYSKSDCEKTKKRLNYYRNNIFSVCRRWLEASPMIVYEVDGKYYMVDGQGRFRALLVYNEKVDDIEKINEIPVLVFYNKTHKEMIHDMIELNRHGKNWSTTDIFRCYALNEGKMELYDKLVEIQDRLRVGEYTAKLILFGYGKSSHRDKIIDATISQYSDVIYSAFDRFYSGTYMACGGNARQLGSIKKQDTAQAFYAVLAKVIRVCENEHLPYQKYLDKCVDCIVNNVNKLDREFEFPQVFGGKAKAISSYFRKYVKNGMKKERCIVNAMSSE